MIDHLPEIGCRDNKQWFLVKHREKQREFLLTVVPKVPEMLLPFGTSTVKHINELLAMLDHPYIYPIEEVAFQYDREQLITVNLYNRKGTIKDYLYSSHSLDDWDVKYLTTGKPLTIPVTNLRLYGRQILEGLLFLKSKGFPYFGHLHSGNVLLEDRVCRLTGYENLLFSVKPKLKPLLRKYAESDMKHFDVLSFGHLLYEMATGDELDTAIPESRHYLAVKHQHLTEVLQFIFNVQSSEYPSIKKISRHAFFRDVRLSELVIHFPQQINPPPGVKHILKTIKRNSPRDRSKKPRGSVGMSVLNETSPEKPRRSHGDNSENSSQASSSSRTHSSSRKPSSSSRRPSKMVPLTPVVASGNEDNMPLFSDEAESESLVSGMSRVTSSTPVSDSRRLKAGSVLSVGSPQKPEMTSEMTALLAEIKGTVTLRKSYNEEEV